MEVVQKTQLPQSPQLPQTSSPQLHLPQSPTQLIQEFDRWFDSSDVSQITLTNLLNVNNLSDMVFLQHVWKMVCRMNRTSERYKAVMKTLASVIPTLIRIFRPTKIDIFIPESFDSATLTTPSSSLSSSFSPQPQPQPQIPITAIRSWKEWEEEFPSPVRTPSPAQQLSLAQPQSPQPQPQSQLALLRHIATVIVCCGLFPTDCQNLKWLWPNLIASDLPMDQLIQRQRSILDQLLKAETSPTITECCKTIFPTVCIGSPLMMNLLWRTAQKHAMDSTVDFLSQRIIQFEASDADTCSMSGDSLLVLFQNIRSSFTRDSSNDYLYHVTSLLSKIPVSLIRRETKYQLAWRSTIRWLVCEMVRRQSNNIQLIRMLIDLMNVLPDRILQQQLILHTHWKQYTQITFPLLSKAIIQWNEQLPFFQTVYQLDASVIDQFITDAVQMNARWFWLKQQTSPDTNKFVYAAHQAIHQWVLDQTNNHPQTSYDQVASSITLKPEQVNTMISDAHDVQSHTFRILELAIPNVTNELVQFKQHMETQLSKTKEMASSDQPPQLWLTTVRRPPAVPMTLEEQWKGAKQFYQRKQNELQDVVQRTETSLKEIPTVLPVCKRQQTLNVRHDLQQQIKAALNHQLALPTDPPTLSWCYAVSWRAAVKLIEVYRRQLLSVAEMVSAANEIRELYQKTNNLLIKWLGYPHLEIP